MATIKNSRRTNAGIKKGDIFKAICGWSIRYYRYFEVVRCVGKATVEVREIAKTPSGQQGIAYPLPGHYASNVTLRGFVDQSGETPRFTPAKSRDYARLMTPEAFAKDVERGVWEDYMD